MTRSSPPVHVLLVFLGIAVAFAGMVYLAAGVQHGSPRTGAHRLDTMIGAVLLSAGLLLQAWPAATVTSSNWTARGQGDRRGVVVKACVGLVGMVVAVAGLSYMADGTQPGAPGGMGVNPSTGEPDPSLAGNDGQAGDVGDAWIGTALTLIGIALQVGLAFTGGKHKEPGNGIFRTRRSTRPLGLREPRGG